MATMAQFSQNIRKRGSQIENAGSRVVRATSKRALKVLVRTTPVDEGVARSNWRVGIGAQTSAVIDAYSPGKNLGIGERANAAAAIAAGFARINSVRGVSGAGGGLKTAVYIGNSVPYIQELNNGSSKQIAAGFIERALSEVNAVIKNFRVFTTTDSDGEGE